MINDLKVDALTWKYVDDTTISQTIPCGSLGDVQHAVTAVEDWSRSQRMQLNADKCKEMVIDFKKISHNICPLEVDGNELPVTYCAKILGVTISSDLKWNNHIVDCIKKANKHLYLIVLLKRARVALNEIVNFYCTTIRPVLEYCAPVFHHAFPVYLNEDIGRIQKRALSIILPAMSYRECLDSLDLLLSWSGPLNIRWSGDGIMGRDSEFSESAVKTVLKCNCRVGPHWQLSVERLSRGLWAYVWCVL